MDIKDIEKEIDAAFESNILTSISYSQAVWELLSYLECEYYGLTVAKGSAHDNAASVDNMINFMSYPLRSCFNKCARKGNKLKASFNKINADAAHDWYRRSYDYNNFCSIFPLVNRNELSLHVNGNNLKTSKDLSCGVPYEAYNRLAHKTGASERSDVDSDAIYDMVGNHKYFYDDKLAISWNESLSKSVISIFEKSQAVRYHLPETWSFTRFSFSEFRTIAIAISALSYARYVVTTIDAASLPELGYAQRVWVISKNDFIKILVEATGYQKEKITDVLEYLTFGSMGIKYPDVATQPLFDSEDGRYLVSPFLFINSDVERNVCALLNQIDEDKKIYSSLVDEKETVLYGELEKELSNLGFRCESGKVSGTDLDLAIIDDEAKSVLTVELKWFIEPAEIREVIQRSKEIGKGIEQAKKINCLLEKRDKNLFENILKISNDFSHYSIVGSFNWIGFESVQDMQVPVIKVGHLLRLLKDGRSISDVIEYLSQREYLPVLGKDYDVAPLTVKSGDWTCEWYGLKFLDKKFA